MQPFDIRLNPEHAQSLGCYGITDLEMYRVRLQDREPGDNSKIVYITNKMYDSSNRFSPQFVALTENEYQTISYK